MQRGLLLKEDFDDIQEVLIRTYPFIEFEESAIDGILELMYNDKKNEDGKILSVLLTSIGSASFRNEITEYEVRLALKHLSMLSASSK
jgi:3-dehydroquinate synthetase